MKELLTIDEVMKALKIKSRKTIYNYMKKGLPYLKIENSLRFDPDEVMNYLKNKER